MKINRKRGWKIQRRKDRQTDKRVGKKWQKKGLMDKGSERVPLWWTERQRQTDKERERGMGLLWINDCTHQKMNVLPRSLRNSACKWKESQSNEEWIHKWISKPINKWINVKGRLWSMHTKLCTLCLWVLWTFVCYGCIVECINTFRCLMHECLIMKPCCVGHAFSVLCTYML